MSAFGGKADIPPLQWLFTSARDPELTPMVFAGRWTRLQIIPHSR